MIGFLMLCTSDGTMLLSRHYRVSNEHNRKQMQSGVVSDVSCDMEKGIDILYTRVYNIINKRERQSNGSGAHKDPINNPADAGKEETNKLNWIMGS